MYVTGQVLKSIFHIKIQIKIFFNLSVVDFEIIIKKLSVC